VNRLIPPDRVPWRLLAPFAFLVLLPTIAVVWLGILAIRQNEQSENDRLTRLTEQAAGRLIEEIRTRLKRSETLLTTREAPADDGVLLVFHADHVETIPATPLLYHPNLPFTGGSESRVEADARAGALMELALTQRQRGEPAKALQTYDALAAVREATVDGVPAELAARRARCRVLQITGDRVRLAGEASALRDGLLSGRWRIDAGTFEQYLHETAGWLGTSVSASDAAERLAAAAAYIWAHRASARPEPQRALQGDVVLLWQAADNGLVALVAGPAFQEQQWLEPAMAAASLKPSQVTHTSRRTPADSGAGVSGIVRAADVSGLPWDLVIAPDVTDLGRDQRRLMTAGLTVLILLVLSGGYVTTRAISRELAVARLHADFVASVSHEFRTPLTSLRQFTDLLRGPAEPPTDKRRRFYAAQARATERLQRLVESLLDFRRMEAGAHRYERRQVCATTLVKKIVEDVRPEASAHGFTIEYVSDRDHAAIDADPEALTLAVWNLLDNAMKYSLNGGTVGVSLTCGDGRVAISVRDQGIGIPPGQHKDIFEKFVRGRDERVRRIKGTGLGLAMVRHIVRGHGGRILVESEPNRGSTFTIELPAAA
jgi:signal transduction histidine kinase